MITDSNLQLSGAWAAGAWTPQTVTGASAVISTNVVDLGVARDIGEGTELSARVSVLTAFAGLTALTIEVVTADDAGISTNVTPISSSGAIPVARLTAGATFAVNIGPQLGSNGHRYLALRYTPTGTGTAGAVVADIGADLQDGKKFYASGFSVK